MGYFMFDAIVVTSYIENGDEIRKAVLDLIPDEIDESTDCKRIVSELIPSIRNSDTTFFLVAPDGGKEGWGFSNSMNEVYKKITLYLDSKGVKYVHVRFGESPSYIITSNGD